MAGIQAQAGVLTLQPPAGQQNQQLTKKAKQRFVDDVIAELSAVGAGLPCGPAVQAVDSATLQRLHDESQFPEFHANWLGDQGTYTKIARALDIKGTYLLMPFIDPFALFNIPGIPPLPPVRPGLLAGQPPRAPGRAGRPDPPRARRGVIYTASQWRAGDARGGPRSPTPPPP